VLRTSKNYIHNVGATSFYDLYTYVRTCSSYVDGSGNEIRVYGFLPYTGNVTFSIREYDPGPPGQSSYNYTLENAPWGNPTTVTLYVPDGRIRLYVPSNYGRTAGLVKARPTDWSYGWSEEVHLNRQTLWQLKPINSYWPTSTSGQRSYSGQSYLAEVTFSSEIGNRQRNYFHPPSKNPPTEIADAVMYFVKNNRYGYIVPGLPDPWITDWDNLWQTGNANALFWIKICGLNGNNRENWLVANGGEVYHSPANWENWQNEDYMISAQPWWSAGTDPYQCASTDVTDMRNYMLSPEYVGQGWGIYLKVKRGGSPNTCTDGDEWIWFAEADFYKDYEIPGLENQGRDIVQLRMWEAYAGVLEINLDPYDPPTGHREDWYFDTDGVVRVEDRSIGPMKWYGAGGWIRTRVPAYYDPDIFHREIMECPHVSMTADGN